MKKLWTQYESRQVFFFVSIISPKPTLFRKVLNIHVWFLHINQTKWKSCQFTALWPENIGFVWDILAEKPSLLSLFSLLPEGGRRRGSVQAWCWQVVQRPEDRRRHTETKRERCSVCGQGSWCNWCNGCLSFLLRCHSLMTRPSSSGSLWQNTGTRSAGRRLSDSAAVADAFHPPMRPSPQSPLSFPLSFLVCLFVWHLVVPWVYPASSIIDVGPFNTGQHSLFICR